LTKEALIQRLEAAKEIELRNVKFKNYFRVEADVWIDGELFLQRAVSETAQNENDIQDGPGIPSQFLAAYRWQQPQSSSGSGRAVEHPVTVHRVPVAIQTLLNTPVDCSMLSDDTPLLEALTTLADSVQPQLPLLVFWNDLQVNAVIEKETPIGVSGLGRMTLRQALNTILRSVSAGGPRLVLVTEGGLIKLGTDQTLLNKKSTHVYAIEDLLAPPSTGDMYNQGAYGGNGGLGQGGGYSR
jgi:hypothetical protein